MGNHKSTVEIETDSINEEVDLSSSTECDLYNIVHFDKVSVFEEWREKWPNIIRTTDPNGNNLVHLAAYLNRYNMIRHLSQYVDVNVANNLGDTPLHLAANKGYKDCIEALLGNGANVNVKNKCGSTPLHAVTMIGRNDCVEILLGYGANVNVPNCGTRTVLPTEIEAGDFIVQKFSFDNDYLALFSSDIPINEEQMNQEEEDDMRELQINLENPKIQDNALNILMTNSAAEVSGIAPSPSINLKYLSFTKGDNEGGPLLKRRNCFRAAARTIEIGRRMTERAEDNVLDLEVQVEPDGDSPLQCAINSNNLAIFNLMIDHSSTLKITDDASFKLVEKAMSMNVPGVLRCLIGIPPEDSHEEFTTDYLEQRLSSCIGKQGKNICVDYYPLIPSTFRNMETLLLIFLGISRDNNFEGLLQHPTVRTFLQWRWNRIANYFYMNLCFFIVVCLNIMIYKSQYYSKNDNLDSKGYISYTLILLNLIPVILREVLQIHINWRLYLLNSENYFEVSLIVYSMVLLFWYPEEVATRIQVSAVGNILIAVSVTLQIGQHPWAASAVHLLKVVAYKFLRHFIVYIGILIGFAYSFHELRSIDNLDPNSELPSNSTSKETDSLNWLEFAGFTILRTAGMFIGELNLGEFNVDKSNFVLITILFLFIMFVSVMMLNLLNGLAVSNIFEKDELRISHFKTRIQYLYGVNSKLNLFHIIINKFPTAVQNVLQRILPKTCNNNDKSTILILPTYLNRKDLKISDDQPYIHNNKIHKDAYEKLQRKVKLNFTSC